LRRNHPNKLRRRAVTPSDPGVLANIVGELIPKHTTLWRPTEAAPDPDFPCVTELASSRQPSASNPTKPLDQMVFLDLLLKQWRCVDLTSSEMPSGRNLPNKVEKPDASPVAERQ